MDDGFSAEKNERANDFFFLKKNSIFPKNGASEEATIFFQKNDFPQNWGERRSDLKKKKK